MRQRACLGILLAVMLLGGVEARAVSETVGPPFARGGMEEYLGCYSNVQLLQVVEGRCGFDWTADVGSGRGSLEAWAEAAGDGQIPSQGASRGSVVFRDTFEVSESVEKIWVSVQWFIEEAFARHTGLLYRELKPGNRGISGWSRFTISTDVSKADCWQCQGGRSLWVIEATRGGDPAPPIQNTSVDQSFQLTRIDGGLLSPGTYDLRLRAYATAFLNGNYQGIGDTGRASAGAKFGVTNVSVDY